MTGVSVKSAYIKLARSVLAQAIKDVRYGTDIEGPAYFAKSDWCETLCELAEVGVDQFRREVAEAYVKAVYGLKPKRIKTYLIAEVLKEWRG